MPGSSDPVGQWLRHAGRQPLLTPAEELHQGRMVRAWLDHPDPDPRTIKRGRRARDRLVTGNLRLVAMVASRHRRRYPRLVMDADMPDLLQAGAIGLTRAAEKFDPERGYKFSTFSYWWILQGCQRWVLIDARTIKLPAIHGDRIAKICDATGKLLERLGHQPSTQQIADELGESFETVSGWMRTGQPCLSLDYLIEGSDNDETFLEFYIAPNQEEPNYELHALIDSLPAIQATMIRQLYGIGKHTRMSKLDIARHHGMSRTTLNRHLDAAHATLQGQQQLSLGSLG